MHIILRACFGATKVNSAVYLPEFLSRLSSPSFIGRWRDCALWHSAILSCGHKFRVKSSDYFLVYRTYGLWRFILNLPVDSSGPSLL